MPHARGAARSRPDRWSCQGDGRAFRRGPRSFRWV